MAAQGSLGLILTELELIRETFRLDGEDVIRLRTGKVVKPPKRWPPAVFVKWLGDGKQFNLQYHRIKFALARGYLPDFVDHHNVDNTDHRIDNLREATRTQNQCNRRRVPRKEPMPRGVQRAKTGSRFMAKVRYENVQHYLGTYDTPEEASAVVETTLKKLHGDFYHG